MALTIDKLEIQIDTNARRATGGIDSLSASLEKLKVAVGGSSGLASNLTQISTAIKTLNGVGNINLAPTVKSLTRLQSLIPTLGGSGASSLANNLTLISSSLATLSAVPKMSVGMTSIASGIERLMAVTAQLDTARLTQFTTQMKGVAVALSQLNAVGKSNIGSVLNQLRKIPEITKSLDPATIEQFSEAVRRLVEALAPLAAQMETVGRGFASLPKYMRMSTSATNRVLASNNRLNFSYGTLFGTIARVASRFWTLYFSMRMIVNVFAEAFNESNEYIENLNLFTVTMGDATDAAMDYAETVSAAMGINIADWIANQGVFQRMATGFGIVSDQAEVMSKNLTQLAYDMSSFFNTDVETAMQKLQSGMSGQIKGLKAWGYNLSVAALEETALSLGIEQSVRSMTEAQKAQLRYITLIQRSNGVMGDMARTINTPANAMRILSAQMDRLKRAFGNLISIITVKIIPYIQAFTELLEESVNSWAKALGFKVTEIDYSNLELAEEVIDGIGDEIDENSDSVAALKKQLAGFDELNILKDGSDSAKDGVSYDLGIELPDYDFLAGLDTSTRERIDAIKAKVKEFSAEIDKLLPLLKAVGTALVVSWSVNGIMGVINAIKALPAAQAIVAAFIGVMQNFDLAFGAGEGVVKSFVFALKSGVKTLRSSLSPMVKILAVVAGAIITFETLKNNIKGLTDGSKSFGEALLGIIPICSLVGIAVYVMTGPIGLVVAAIAGLVGAVVGYKEAQKEMIKELVNTTFYAEYGAKVSGLADAFGDLMSASTSAYDAILAKQNDILTAKGNISDTLTEVDALVFSVESGATRIEDAIPTIVSAFETLYNDTKGFLTDTRDLIIGALSGSIGDVLKEQGIIIENVSAAAGKITQGALDAIEALNAENAKIKSQWEAGTITDDEYFKQITANIAEIQKYSGVSGEQAEAIKNANQEFANAINDALSGNLTWENADEISGALAGITESADATKDTIKEAYGAIIDAVAEEKRLAEMVGDTEAANLFSNTITALTTAMNNDVASVDNMLNSTVNALQKDLYEKLAKVYSDAKAEYADKGWFYKLFTSEATHVADALEEYKNGPFAEMLALIKEKFPNADLWVEEAVKAAVGNAKNYERAYGNSETTNFPESNFLSEMEKYVPESAKNTITGLTNALADGQGDVYNAAQNLGNSVKSGYDNSLGIHSPSVEMEKRGEYSIQGLVNGLSNMSLLKVAIGNIVNQFDILAPIKRLWDKVVNWWSNISLPDINLFGNLGAKISGAFSLGQYASGGFPTMGEMFIANERGPELVGRIGNKNAVANNDQIVQGIASAVYGAMMAAQEDGKSGNGGSARIVVQIGDQAVGEASVRYINGQIMQTGASPIYS